MNAAQHAPTRTLEVSLSAAQLQECQHKASIVCDEPDLQESYDISKADADALRDLLNAARPGRIALTVPQMELLAGELENAAEIDIDNVEAGDHESRASLASNRDGVRKLNAAIARAEEGTS